MGDLVAFVENEDVVAFDFSVADDVGSSHSLSLYKDYTACHTT